ncbi:hypothetical protein ACG74X_02505 [Marivita sp. S0852]|uniref:hypothetical protein n=1 Tax=Marivita sp. S0852 TaxID=3373893 RepID=UPI0039822AFF
MPILVLYCGFYLFGLLLARWLTLPRQALISGIATAVAAGVASLTLWLLTRTMLIEPWLAIAMTGAVALPALMLGLGLMAGAWIRFRHTSGFAVSAASVPPAAIVLIYLFG